MKNNTLEEFLNCMKKVDNIDIVLKNKLEGIYNKKIFLLKKNMFWISI